MDSWGPLIKVYMNGIKWGGILGVSVVLVFIVFGLLIGEK